MLRDQFVGRNPSHFYNTNPIVKAFIISEILIWSAWNFVMPVFAIFAATQIPGGNIEVAGSSYSAHLIVRVFAELIVGKYLFKATELKKFVLAVVGIVIISLAFIGFATAKNIGSIYLFYAFAGVGIGMASPAKNSLFSMHLDKNREAAEWGLYDAATFTGTALAATLGAVVAKQYGFFYLFLLASFVNILGVIPYLPFINDSKKGK